MRRVGKVLLVFAFLVSMLSDFPVASIKSKAETTGDSTTATLTIHYKRTNADYDGWNLWYWGGVQSSTNESNHPDFINDSSKSYGKMVSIQVNKGQEVGFKLRRSTADNAWANETTNLYITIDQDTDIYLIDDANGYSYESTTVPQVKTVNVHYKRKMSDYTNWNFYSWLQGGIAEPFNNPSIDGYGRMVTLNLPLGIEYQFIIRKSESGNDYVDKNYKDNQVFKVTSDLPTNLYYLQGQKDFYREIVQGSNVPVKDTATITVHYNRTNSDYDTWGVHVWGTGIPTQDTAWDNPHFFQTADSFGRVTTFDAKIGSTVGMIIKNGSGNKNCDANQYLTVEGNTTLYVNEGRCGYSFDDQSLNNDVIVRLHYGRNDAEDVVKDWDVHTWNNAANLGDVKFTVDPNTNYDGVATFTVKNGSSLYYIIRKTDWSMKNFGDDQYMNIYDENHDGFVDLVVLQDHMGYLSVSPSSVIYPTVSTLVSVHQKDGNYDGLTLKIDDQLVALDKDNTFGKYNLVTLPKDAIVKVQLSTWSNPRYMKVTEAGLFLDADDVNKSTDRVYTDAKSVELKIHYRRTDYTNWDVFTFGGGIYEEVGIPFSSEDSFGKVAIIRAYKGSNLSYIIRDKDWNKNCNNDQVIPNISSDMEIYVREGQCGYDLDSGLPTIFGVEDITIANGQAFDPLEGVTAQDKDGNAIQVTYTGTVDVNTKGTYVLTYRAEDVAGVVKEVKRNVTVLGTTATLTIHYQREDNTYTGWNLWAWWPGNDGSSHEFTSEDDFGKIATIEVDLGTTIGFKTRLSTADNEWVNQDPKDRSVLVDQNKEIWLVADDMTIYTEKPTKPAEKATLTVHYQREDKNYTGWNFFSWGGKVDGDINFRKTDDFGSYITVEVNKGTELGFIVRKSITGNEWNEKDVDADRFVTVNEDTEIWLVSGVKDIYTEKPTKPIEKYTLTVHYQREDNNYKNWDFYTWVVDGRGGLGTSFTSSDDFGQIATIEVNKDSKVGFIIRNGGDKWLEKDFGSDQFVTVTKDTEIWVISGFPYYSSKPAGKPKTATLTIHYRRNNADYAGWNLWVWNSGPSDGMQKFTTKDDWGKIATFEVVPGSKVGYIIRKSIDGNEWADKNNTADQFVTVKNDMEIWVDQGMNGFATSEPKIVEHTLTIHYQRNYFDYDGWDLWTWGTGFEDGKKDFEFYDGFGLVSQFKVKEGSKVGYIVRFGGDEWLGKNCGDDQFVDIKGDTELWITQDQCGILPEKPENTGELKPLSALQTDPNADTFVYFHYQRTDSTYNDLFVYLDGATTGQSLFAFNDQFGGVARVGLNSADLGDLVATNGVRNVSDEKAQFSVLSKTSDLVYEITRDFDFSALNTVGGKKVLHLYFIEGDVKVYTDPTKVIFAKALTHAEFVTPSQLIVRAIGGISATDAITVLKEDTAVEVKSSTVQANGAMLIELKDTVDSTATYYVSSKELGTKIQVIPFGGTIEVVTPNKNANAKDEESLPWLPIGIGTGVLILIAGAIFLIRRRNVVA